MFNKLVGAASALSIAVMGAVSAPAQAYAGDGCYTARNGYYVCRVDNGDYGADWLGAVSPDGRSTRMNVVCTGGGGNRWRANGSFSRTENQALASWWCQNY